MAAFVDCTKYTKEQDAQDKALQNLTKKSEEQDKSIKALGDREIIHDNTLTGGGIDKSNPLSVAVSTKLGNAVKTGEAAGGSGMFVKDLQPEVDVLKKALSDTNNRLSSDIVNRIKDLNNQLNNVKAVEVALVQAKAAGNYQHIKDVEAQLAAAKHDKDLANKNLADAIEALRQQGLTDAQIRQIISDSIVKAGGTGRYITNITVNQETGDVTYTYSDGTKVTGKLYEFQGVVVDNKTIGGDGASRELHVKISKANGNSLLALDDGLYYGSSRNIFLYVDNVGGDDNNVGTRGKPLKTLNKALERSREVLGGFAYIFLHEEQTHIYKFDSIFNVENYLAIKTYGSKYDEINTEYRKESPMQGSWIPELTDEFKAIMPKLVFIPGLKTSYRGVVGDFTTAFRLIGKNVTLTGIGLSFRSTIGDVPNGQWRSLFYGEGRLNVYSCYIDNSNSGRTWTLASDHDGSLSVDAIAVELATKPSGMTGTIFHIATRMEITFKAENNTYMANNTHISPSTNISDMLDSVYGKGENSAYIGNFSTNVKL